MKLSIVFPTFNEAASITGVVEDFLHYCVAHQVDHEIIVVNDGSTDATGRRVAALAARHPTIRQIHHDRNQGYGAALRTGFAAATGDFIFFTDSDGQFSAADLDRTIPLINDHSIVVGYRFPRVEKFWRRFNAAVWGAGVGLILGFHIRDLNCAWKVFPRALLRNIQFISNGAFISAELMYYANQKGLAFQEISVRHYPRQAGQATGARLRVIGRAIQELARFLVQRPG